MKSIPWGACGFLLGALAGGAWMSAAADVPAPADKSRPSAQVEVAGRTRCPLAQRGIIAPAILRPVVAVLVNPGDRVKKGQVLIKLYDQEVQAKVQARDKELKSIQARAQQSRRSLELAEASRKTGALPENTYNEIRATSVSNDRQVQAAEAELALAQSELKLYAVTAAIDGEIAWMDVSPGTVSWPGALVWGEIVDLHELDVRCELPVAQVEHVSVGQSAEVRLDGKTEPVATGKVSWVGKVADRNSGLLPVAVRIVNPQERVRAEIPVKVRFLGK